MLPNVSYSRSNRCYHVTNPTTGELSKHPAGADGKRAAFVAAASILAPSVVENAHRIIQRHPHLEGRVWKAVEMVIEGGVTAVEDDTAVLAIVASQSEYGRYLVQLGGAGYTCDCLDFVDFQAPHAHGSNQRMCKHILAWKLWERNQPPY